VRALNLIIAGVVMLALAACGGGDAESEQAASFASPSDGETVSSPVTVEMAAEGFEVAPAEGSTEGQGHFHVMVDTDCVVEGETIPNDDSHLHFGDGSTSTQIELEPGEHTLCVQAGDQVHNAFGETTQITITVE
jgi:hypothetical protein